MFVDNAICEGCGGELYPCGVRPRTSTCGVCETHTCVGGVPAKHHLACCALLALRKPCAKTQREFLIAILVQSSKQSNLRGNDACVVAQQTQKRKV